jgi:hypothetical protein
MGTTVEIRRKATLARGAISIAVLAGALGLMSYATPADPRRPADAGVEIL